MKPKLELNKLGLKELPLMLVIELKLVLKGKDYHTSALLILLYGLSLLKTQGSYSKIKTEINTFLDTLGMSKTLVKETFYVSLLILILDILVENLDDYKPKFKQFLKILPLFEEEKELIKFT